MLAQNELERELYEGRLKAKRDMQTLESQRQILESQRREAEAERVQWQERYQAAKRLVVRQIQFCERLLRREQSEADQLMACNLDQLRDLAETLERELTR